jgi:acyl-CoA reductase-like NAD-dependent aldehyde dehydrogenase
MSQEFITISPIDGSAVVKRAYASEQEIARALSAAQSAQREWSALAVAQRAAVVGAAVDALLADKARIAEAITLQMGRPARHAPLEVDGYAARARHMIDIADAALRPLDIENTAHSLRRIVREPIGVTLTIAPWNYPLLTAVNSIVPSLLAGNAVILKHSDQTPLCAELIHASFVQSGAPAGLFQFVHASHDITHRMVRAPEIGYVAFTGSVAGGKAVEESAAGRFIGVGLELGGSDPAYVRADADIDAAVETLVDGAYFNAGQSCCGIQRIYVARPVCDRFVDQAADLAACHVLGDPRDAATTLGPVVRAAAARQIREIVGDAVARGARNHVDAGGFAAAGEEGAYVAPALLTQVDHSMRLMNDECFGPVAGVMPVDGDDAAVELMNDSPYGLTAAVFTRDVEAARHLAARVRTGTFFMNRCDYLDPALAWTGVKNSGRGVSLSALGYEYLTRPKSLHLRISSS